MPESDSPLYNAAVHPESYAAAQKLLELCGYTMEQVKAGTWRVPAFTCSMV